ncbi:MAG: serine protease [Planctomycetota bacterium]|nr:serine protease [Planctomycetota bacterium]
MLLHAHLRSILMIGVAAMGAWGFSAYQEGRVEVVSALGHDSFLASQEMGEALDPTISAPSSPVMPAFDELDAVILDEVSDSGERVTNAPFTTAILAEERARILAQMNISSDGLKRWVGTEIDRTRQTIEDLDSRIEARIESMVPTVESLPRPPIVSSQQHKVERMIYPIVQLRGNGTVGSGVVVSSEAVDGNLWATWIVTAYHVVEEVRDFSSDEVVVDEIRFFDPQIGRLGSEAFRGVEIASLKGSDLSLVRVDRKSPWLYIAETASEPVCLKLSVFDTVYAVGCPLGNQPLPTYGEISSQYKPVGDEIFWMVSAPTFFGNSGGGIFLANEGQLVGISSMIYTYGKRSPMVVPHMGLFVPMQTVRSWLRREGFAHLMDPHPMVTPVPASSGHEETHNGVSGSF